MGIKIDKKAALRAGGMGRMLTGIYSMIIVRGWEDKTSNGDTILNLELENSEGQRAFIFNLCTEEKWSTGKENFMFARVMELFAVLDVTTISYYKDTIVQKDKKVKIKAIKELKGKKLKMAVQIVLTVYNDEEQQKLQLVNSFYKDGKSLLEKEKGKDAKRIKLLEKKLTDYETQEWKDWKNLDDDDEDEDFEKPKKKGKGKKKKKEEEEDDDDDDW